MEILIIAGTLSGAFFVAFLIIGFILGIQYQKKKGNDEAIHVKDADTAEAVKNLLDWFTYDGGGK